MIKGKEKETGSVGTAAAKYIGFTSVEVRAVNPSRSELNKLLGKEDSGDDKELEYSSTDQEGNKRVRLSFWLFDAKLDKYFVYSFNLTDKERMNKDQTKNQFINNTGLTAWADKEENLFDWFTNFTDREKNVLGKKEFRKALLGEEELGTLLRSWLGRMSWNDPDTSVMIDTTPLFKEDFSELRQLIDSDYDTPFVILTGVKTDESDPTKQYQQVYGKNFLPANFISYINKNLTFPTDYAKKAWERFEKEATGEYGFSSYFELVPLTEYDKDKDVAASPTTVGVTATNSKY